MTFSRDIKYTVRTAVALTLLFSLLNMSGGCSLLRGSVHGVAQPPERTGRVLEDLYTRAQFFRSITLSGRLKLTVKGHDLASVKIRSWLLSTRSRRYMRIRGFAPFGITVFDFLSRGDNAYIYLPRAGKVLEGSRFFTSYGSIDVKDGVKVMESLLNPWAPANSLVLQQVACSKGNGGVVCLMGNFLSEPFIFEYLRDNLAPSRFYSADCDVSFSQGLKTIPVYPRQIRFRFYRAAVSGTLTISRVAVVDLSPKSPLFDQSPFLKWKRR